MPRLSSIAIEPTPGALTTTGIKGRLSLLPLSPVTILAGKNRAGKSTVSTDALTVAVHGLTDRPNDTERPYFESPPIGTSIKVTLDDGAGWTRDLSAGPRSGEAKAASTAALTVLGAVPPGLNLSAILSGDPKERRLTIARIARIGGKLAATDSDGVRALLLSAHLASLPDDGPDSAVWISLGDAVLRSLTEHRDDGAAWLTAAEPIAIAAQKEANKAQRLADGLLTDKTERLQAARAAVPPAPDTTATDEHLAALQSERDTLIGVRAAAQQSVQARTEHAGRGTRLEADLTRAKEAGLAAKARAIADRILSPAGEPLAYVGADLSGYLAAVATAEAEHAAPIPPAPDVDLTPYLSAVGQAQDALDTATAGALAAERKHEAAQTAAETAATAAHRASQDLVAIRSDEARAPIEAHNAHLRALAAARIRAEALTGVAASQPCRSCGEPDPHGHGAAADEARAELEALEAQSEAIIAAGLAADKAHAAVCVAFDAADRKAKDAATNAIQASTALDAAHAAVTAAETRLRTAQTALDAAKLRAEKGDPTREPRIRTERQARLDRATREIAQARDLDTRAADAHAAASEAYQTRIAQLRADMKAAQDALAEWKALPSPGGDVADPAPRLAEIDTQIAALRAAATKAGEAHRTAAANVATAEAELREAIDKAAECKAAAQSAAALSRAIPVTWVEISRPAVAPIHDLARAVAEGTGLPMPWFDGVDEAGVIQCGVEHASGLRVHYTEASGSEARIVGALLLLAMTAIQGARVPVLMLDELDALVDPAERLALVRAIASAAEKGLISNAIITEAGDLDAIRALYAGIPGVTVVHPDDVSTRVERGAVVERVAVQAVASVDDDAEIPF